MRSYLRLILFFCVTVVALILAAPVTEAQPPPGKKGDKKGGGQAVGSLVEYLMSFDKNKDGKLTKEELTDTRLHSLFDRADANKDGAVTREEAEALNTRESADAGGGGKGDFGKGDFGKGDKGDKGKGPPDGKKGDKKGPPDGKKGKGPPGFFGEPPQPGLILTTTVQDTLRLDESQRKRVTDLQKDVDSRLDQILTDEQRQQLRDLRKGPGGFGPGDKGPKGK